MESSQSSKPFHVTGIRRKPKDDPAPQGLPGSAQLLPETPKEPQRKPASTRSTDSPAGFFGRKPFAKKPWYLLTGPLGCGKSTALRCSGMRESLDTAWKNTKSRSVKEIADYDFYSTHDAVWVDTSGRYVDLANETLNSEAWQDLFKQIAKQRARNTFQGILAMVSLAEHTPGRFSILTANAHALERQALMLRSFIDEFMAFLGARFPVYLIISKCDLVCGFAELFDDLEGPGLEQVWGYTLPPAQSQTEFPHEIVAREHERLGQILKMRRMQKLPTPGTLARKRDIYNFPLQWQECRQKLADFAGHLFQHDPEREPVFWRGVYFISSTQEGQPVDTIGKNLVAYLSLPAENSKPVEREPKSYFLKKLFAGVILADRHLLLPYAPADRRQRLMQWACSAAALLFAIIMVTGLSISYRANTQFLQTAQHAAERAAVPSLKNFSRAMQTLDSLRVIVKNLEKGKPLAMRWGLYQGEKIMNPAKKIYFASLYNTLVQPAQEVLEQRLNQPFLCAANRDSCFLLLKVYLMLDTSRCGLEKGLLSGKLLELSRQRWPNSSLSEAKALSRQVDFYVEHLKDPNNVAIRIDDGLVQAARRQLQGALTLEMVYSNVKAAAEQTLLTKIDLDIIFQEQEQNILTGEYTIPGLFTKPGWERMKDEMERFSSAPPQQNCVLGSLAGSFGGLADRTTMRKQLEGLYFKEYLGHWNSFVQDLEVRRFSSLADAAEALDVLAVNSSPLLLLVQTISEHTDFKDEMTFTRFAAWEQKSPVFSSAPPLVQIQNDFKTIHRLLPAQEGVTAQNPPLAPYFEALTELQGAVDELAAGPESEYKNFAGQVLAGRSNALSGGLESIKRSLGNREALLRPLFEQPIHNTWAVILNATQAHLNTQWAEEVHTPFIQTLGKKYPFDSQGREDASLAEVSDFFQQKNGMWWDFFENNLSPFVDRQSWRPKSRGGFEGMRLSAEFCNSMKQADFLSKNLLSEGRVQRPVSLSVRPEPPQNDPGIYRIELHYDGKIYKYDMGQRPLWTLTWPAANNKIRIVVYARDKTPAIKSFDGSWALFRMLRAARMEQSTLYWNFEGMKTNIGFTVEEMNSTLLHAMRNLQSFDCPRKLD